MDFSLLNWKLSPNPLKSCGPPWRPRAAREAAPVDAPPAAAPAGQGAQHPGTILLAPSRREPVRGRQIFLVFIREIIPKIMAWIWVFVKFEYPDSTELLNFNGDLPESERLERHVCMKEQRRPISIDIIRNLEWYNPEFQQVFSPPKWFMVFFAPLDFFWRHLFSCASAMFTVHERSRTPGMGRTVWICQW